MKNEERFLFDASKSNSSCLSISYNPSADSLHLSKFHEVHSLQRFPRISI